MEEANQIKIVKIIAGVSLVGFYALTGMDGLILVMAAFLLGIPLEEFVKRVKKD